jgi:uncharacterized protein YgiM (DUF1202 family)
MTVVRAYNAPLLTTVLVLVLSVLACSGSYLTTAPTTPPETVVKPPTTPKNTVTTVEVTAYEALHVRQHPTTAAAVVGYLYNSDPVTLTGTCQTGWAQIRWQDGTAWVNAKYLSDNICEE